MLVHSCPAVMHSYRMSISYSFSDQWELDSRYSAAELLAPFAKTNKEDHASANILTDYCLVLAKEGLRNSYC